MSRFRVPWIAAAIVSLLAGCSSTKQGTLPTTHRSGFLGDYSNLRAGKEGEPAYVFREPNANFSRYRKAMLEPVEVWRRQGSEGLDVESVQFLADYFYTLLFTRLARDYEMVTTIDDTTLRIRVAYSRVGEEDMRLFVQSTTNPQPNLIPQFREKAKEPPRFAGATSVEAAFHSGMTGALLWAGIERKDIARPRNGDYGWDDLGAELKFDAERLGYMLCEERGDNCPRPVWGR
jgi:hypothetical protein